jgi:hypothetical protein
MWTRHGPSGAESTGAIAFHFNIRSFLPALLAQVQDLSAPQPPQSDNGCFQQSESSATLNEFPSAPWKIEMSRVI